MNAWCAEWGSRIKFFFSELYFRTWCGNSGRIAADFYLHPSEIPDAFMVLHCAVVPLGQGEVPAGGGGHVDVVDCEGLPVILTH